MEKKIYKIVSAVNYNSDFNVTGDISMLKLLIEKDANINAINKHNESGRFISMKINKIFELPKKNLMFSFKNKF